MAQFLRPDGDITATNIANLAPYYDDINESVANDSNGVFTDSSPVNSTYECSLSNPAQVPGVDTTTVRYRASKAATVTSATLTVHVYQGATLIASDSARTLGNSVTGYSFTPNMSAVTDWNDLRLRFVWVLTGGSSNASVTWAEMEAPDPPASAIILFFQ